jgi:signal transduction histidine kinase/CheY-like chemotaxis protein
LATLHSTAIAAAGSSTLDDALQKIVQSVHDAFELANVSIALINEEADELVRRASIGYVIDLMQSVRLKLGQGVAGWVAQTGQPALLPDVSTDQRYVAIDPSVRSELCVPLQTGARTIGVINVESHKVDAFSERDLKLLITLGYQLSTIIENVRLLDEIRQANAQLQELDRLKSQFLANMSHELRTPLNSIIGFSALLNDGVVGSITPEQRECVNNIHTSGRHLLALINDVLDLSKIQAGRMTLDWQRVDLDSLISDVTTIVTPMTEEKHQKLTVEVPTRLPPLYADPLRLKQILLNLLSNAYKFTPQDGQLTLRVDQRDSQTLLFSVQDTGRGVPLAEQATIFEEFRRGEAATASNEEGTGLGLGICQRLVELHGGQIWVESVGQPGLGSTFCFTLPLHADSIVSDDLISPEPIELAPSDRLAAPRKVLIIEDDQQFSELLALYLSQVGYQIEQCFSGENALSVIREVRPDFVTLDLLLPVKDGWSILREMKSDPELREIGVVVISALDGAGTGLQGSLDYLTKPLIKSDLLKALRRVGLPRPDRPVRILAVDDDPMLIELLQAMLPPPDYELIGAMDAARAIDQLTVDLPDLMILDLLMPGMNGFELLKLLRADERTRDLSVIVLTAKMLTGAEQEELSQSAQATLTKSSIQRDKLLDEIRRLEQFALIARAGLKQPG